MKTIDQVVTELGFETPVQLSYHAEWIVALIERRESKYYAYMPDIDRVILRHVRALFNE
jgi:hypothetical protein